jgi:hypothetical protein
MKSSGLPQDKCAELLLPFAKNIESARAMAQHYYTDKQQPAIATADIFDWIRPYLPEVPEEIERLVAERTGIEWTAYKNREVIGQNPTSSELTQLRVGSFDLQQLIKKQILTSQHLQHLKLNNGKDGEQH